MEIKRCFATFAHRAPAPIRAPGGARRGAPVRRGGAIQAGAGRPPVTRCTGAKKPLKYPYSARPSVSVQISNPLNRIRVSARLWRSAGKVLQLGSVGAAVALLATCSHSPSMLSRIERTGTLVLATPNSPTTYYLGAYGAAGPDYDLAVRFAASLGVHLKVLEVPNGHAALEAVADGRADVAAPGVSVDQKNFPLLHFTPPYQMVSQVLVYRDGEPVPADLSGLASSDFQLTIAPGYAPLLHRLNAQHPGIHWQVKAQAGADELLVSLAQGQIGYTVVNENEFRINRRFYPHLRSAFALGAPRPLAWAVRRGDDSTLYQAATAFFARAEAAKQVAGILHRYYGELDAYDQVGTQLFLNDVKSRLPDYAVSFERASAATGLPWQLLAAVGYQESHWEAGATSPTGVRGIMMLTQPTAERLGIHNRINPHLSIIGGARYLAALVRRLPAAVPEPDRLWMALAAYNVGFGHVMDARALAKRRGDNPNRWASVRKMLPLLGERRYFRHTQFGYANGQQAVLYVANIKSYYNVLAWRTAQNSLPSKVLDPLRNAAATLPASE